MASLKALAAQAIGLNGGFSTVRDFFGYAYYDTTQTFVNPISLRAQMVLVQERSIHLSVIFVGMEPGFGSGTVVTRQEARDMQAAIQRTRELYAQAPLGIRKIYWSRIGVDEAGSYINITDGSEAEDLTDDWNGNNDGIDVFYVQSIGDAGGWSNSDGPCDKDSICGRTGVVIENFTNLNFYGILLAHEVAHYLGLPGGVGPGNLMGADINPPDGIDELNENSTDLTNAQAATMRSGCYVKSAL